MITLEQELKNSTEVMEWMVKEYGYEDLEVWEVVDRAADHFNLRDEDGWPHPGLKTLANHAEQKYWRIKEENMTGMTDGKN